MVIVKGEENDIRLSLMDSVTISGAVYFLFRFVRKSDNEEKSMLVTDQTSGLVDRYSQFLITESDTEDLSSATISLSTQNSSQAEYICYVYAQNSSTNTNYQLADELIKIEQCLVKGGVSVVNDNNNTTVTVNE